MKVSAAAEVFHVRHRDEPVIFEANRLKLVESRESAGVALRIIKDGKIGFSSTSDFRDPGKLVDKALEMSPSGPRPGWSSRPTATSRRWMSTTKRRPPSR